jgi:hypothetical protein
MKPILAAVVLLGLSACVSVPAPVVVKPVAPIPPRPPAVFCLAPEVHDQAGQPIVGASVWVEGLSGTTNQGGYVYLMNVPASDSTVVEVLADGYVKYDGAYAIDSWSCDLPVTLASAVPPLPNPPTRSQALAIHDSFNSLTVQLSSGSIPWFDAALSSLSSAADRQAVYAAKKANGDTHAIVYFTPGGALYNEPNQPYQNYQMPDYVSNPAPFVALVQEVIRAGFTPMVFLLEDTEANTEGYLAHAVSALQGATPSLLPYVTFNPGFDGIFYGWPPAAVTKFGAYFRTLVLNGVLTMEFNTAHIPLGNGPADFTPTGAMKDYDGVLAEFDLWPMVGDGEWQILGRLFGPNFHRAPNQPATDDPHPPFYLAQPSARGPFVAVCWEWGTYKFVRSQYAPSDLAAAIAYYLALGCPWAN